MHVLVRWNVVSMGARRGARAVVVCGALAGSLALTRPAFAAAEVLDAHALTELEQRALTANVREQAFLYAELADKMTMLASKQIADGQIEDAEATLERMEACTAKMETGLKQSKSLKKTELLLHLTNRRLTDMVRAASMDVKPHVQDALKRLNTAQDSLLALIFAK